MVVIPKKELDATLKHEHQKHCAIFWGNLHWKKVEKILPFFKNSIVLHAIISEWNFKTWVLMRSLKITD